MRKLLYGCVGLLATLANGSTAEQVASWTFSGAQATAIGLRGTVEPDSAEDKALASIANSLLVLGKRYGGNGVHLDTAKEISTNLSANYINSIADDLAALRDLPTDREARLLSLKTVADDLALKATYRSNTPGQVATAVADSVIVQVVVRRPPERGIDPDTLTIRLASCALARGKPAPPGRTLTHGVGIFKDISLPPGCFLFWAQAGDKELKHFAQDIGRGQDSVNFFQEAP